VAPPGFVAVGEAVRTVHDDGTIHDCVMLNP
jgi:hypothetical protein